MKKYKFTTGHRWTMLELSDLMRLWQEEKTLSELAEHFKVSTNAIRHIVVRLRHNGVPLARRNKGHVQGRTNQYWTQGEVEYLVRRRKEYATNEVIAMELSRSEYAVNAMVSKLIQEDVPIPLRGKGFRKLWNADALKAISIVSEVAIN